MRRTHRAGLALLAGAALTACSTMTSAPHTSTAFVPATGHGCMDHQGRPPSQDDSSSQLDVAQRLMLLRYYTAHGSQPFCDQAPASADDLAWMRLFVAQGARAELVARWLHP